MRKELAKMKSKCKRRSHQPCPRMWSVSLTSLRNTLLTQKCLSTCRKISSGRLISFRRTNFMQAALRASACRRNDLRWRHGRTWSPSATSPSIRRSRSVSSYLSNSSTRTIEFRDSALPCKNKNSPRSPSSATMLPTRRKNKNKWMPKRNNSEVVVGPNSNKTKLSLRVTSH